MRLLASRRRTSNDRREILRSHSQLRQCQYQRMQHTFCNPVHHTFDSRRHLGIGGLSEKFMNTQWNTAAAA